MKRMMKNKICLILLTILTSFTMAQNNGIFKGGNADGWQSQNYSQSNGNIFKGGTGDGWNSKNYVQSTYGIFKGGIADGWDAKGYSQLTSNIFKGGIGDGWDSKNYVQINTAIYKGGIGDGWDSKNYTQLSNGIYKGGIGDGWASTYRPQGPLPVTFIYFNANKIKETQSLLSWKTSQEINSAYFEVETSNDALNYINIGRVQAAGNSAVPLFYAFIDHKPFKGMNYYRLKQFDLDGRFVYSPSRLVRFDESDPVIVKYYPNPATDIINIEMTEAMAKEPAVINISNASGIVLIQLKLPGNGTKIIPIKLEQYARGIYFIQVKTGTTNSTQRIVLQ